MNFDGIIDLGFNFVEFPNAQKPVNLYDQSLEPIGKVFFTDKGFTLRFGDSQYSPKDSLYSKAP